MTTTEQFISGPVLDAWQRLLRSHWVIARQLDAELQSEHGMTLSDYDVLVNLREAGADCLKMSELSRRTLLTRSGMTRLIQGLEREGLVERKPCPSDARVSYAGVTKAGLERLNAARATHHAGIRRVFADHYTDEEIQTLADLLHKIPGVDDADAPCTAGH